MLKKIIIKYFAKHLEYKIKGSTFVPASLKIGDAKESFIDIISYERRSTRERYEIERLLINNWWLFGIIAREYKKFPVQFWCKKRLDEDKGHL